jgi:hypothetical protein
MGKTFTNEEHEADEKNINLRFCLHMTSHFFVVFVTFVVQYICFVRVRVQDLKFSGFSVTSVVNEEFDNAC